MKTFIGNTVCVITRHEVFNNICIPSYTIKIVLLFPSLILTCLVGWSVIDNDKARPYKLVCMYGMW